MLKLKGSTVKEGNQLVFEVRTIDDEKKYQKISQLPSHLHHKREKTELSLDVQRQSPMDQKSQNHTITARHQRSNGSKRHC